ncbi:RNA polymerase sigma factor [Streptomyces longwoodensis]|uniref:RNA polymerase sigma factor n=1 Tax=Streptomyces longwoodensis TaxID=68231 RepID=UPI003701E17C
MTPRIPQEHWAEVAALYMMFRDGMLKYAARTLGDEGHMAHDLVQESFKAAALDWEKLRVLDECRQRAWLYRVLKNKMFDHWGETRRRRATPAAPESVADVDTPRTAVSNLLLQMCWKVIDSMPRAQRRVALLRWQGEWTTREIAQYLGLAQSTVRVHLKNARNILARELADEVVFPSEWRDKAPGEEEQDE